MALPDDELLLRLRLHMADHYGEPLHGRFPDAAVAVAMTARAENPSMILTKRASHMRLHRGEIAFPGGKADPEDRNLLQTALREMHEEIGVEPGRFEPLGRLRQRVSRTGIRMTPFVGVVPHGLKLHINRDELESAFEAPLRELMDPRNFHIERVKYRGQEKRVAHFYVGGYDVWGVTAMIIADLLNSVLGAGLPVDVSRR